MYEELGVRIEFFGNEIENLEYFHPITGNKIESVEDVRVFPASHYAAGVDVMKKAIANIKLELEDQLEKFKSAGKLLEAHRLETRCNYDIEMLTQTGFCSGIENYSMHIDGRTFGQPPHCLLDYFPKILL